MRWPFAMRSSVDALERSCRLLYRQCEQEHKWGRVLADTSLEYQRQIMLLNKRLVEITDLDRTTPELMANATRARWPM